MVEYKTENEKKIDMRKELFSWLRLVIIVILVVVVVKQFVIVNAVIPSTSMENMIEEGDRLIGFRLAYVVKDPQRYDIVIFNYPVDESQKYIKRVIGLPGETVEIRDAKIYIDGSESPLNETYLKEEWVVGNDGYTFEVPEDSYLMLGDNRNVSLDARYWPSKALESGIAGTDEEAMSYSYVQKDEILGKAIFKYWPKFSMLTAGDLRAAEE